MNVQEATDAAITSEVVQEITETVKSEAQVAEADGLVCEQIESAETVPEFEKASQIVPEATESVQLLPNVTKADWSAESMTKVDFTQKLEFEENHKGESPIVSDFLMEESSKSKKKHQKKKGKKVQQ